MTEVVTAEVAVIAEAEIEIEIEIESREGIKSLLSLYTENPRKSWGFLILGNYFQINFTKL
jgi:hypothetical protein